MITLLESAEHPIILDSRPLSHLVRHDSAAIGDRARATIRAMSEKLARCFAAFAGVPYHDPLDLKQWEQAWDINENLMELDP